MVSQTHVTFYIRNPQVNTGSVLIAKDVPACPEDLLTIIYRYYPLPERLEISERSTGHLVADFTKPMQSNVVYVIQETKKGGFWMKRNVDLSICYALIRDDMSIVLRAGIDREVSKRFRPLHESVLLRRAYNRRTSPPEQEVPPMNDAYTILDTPPDPRQECFCGEPLSKNEYAQFHGQVTFADVENPESNCDHVMHLACVERFWVQCPKVRNFCPRCHTKKVDCR